MRLTELRQTGTQKHWYAKHTHTHISLSVACFLSPSYLPCLSAVSLICGKWSRDPPWGGMSVGCQILKDDEIWKVLYTPVLNGGCREELKLVVTKIKITKIVNFFYTAHVHHWGNWEDTKYIEWQWICFRLLKYLHCIIQFFFTFQAVQKCT